MHLNHAIIEVSRLLIDRPDSPRDTFRIDWNRLTLDERLTLERLLGKSAKRGA